MGILNILFGSAEATAQHIRSDRDSIVAFWNKYKSTIARKKSIIERLQTDTISMKQLAELDRLLTTDLVDIESEERSDSKLISELQSIEYDEKVWRVHRLQQCLGYAESKYVYVHELLRHSHSILETEMKIVSQLKRAQDDAETLLPHLKSQFKLELEILQKIEKIETFPSLFCALATGEHIIARMSSKEKRLLRTMHIRFENIFSDKISEGITLEWGQSVLNAIEDSIHEAVANGVFIGYHEDIKFEFVNRPEFVDLARNTIHRMRKKEVSEEMLTVFVHLFREWFNSLT
ncbi:MAG: hypothetical protein ABIH41_02085 [Nanoarchaeota archaeon]